LTPGDPFRWECAGLFQGPAGRALLRGIDWARARSLARLLENRPEPGRPIVFKSVGTAAWDLAAARVALESLGLAAAR
jgi:1-piperideine-2-carboxylate/1-pyrroline-2-carboxylate reductase [NAD(P)H]